MEFLRQTYDFLDGHDDTAYRRVTTSKNTVWERHDYIGGGYRWNSISSKDSKRLERNFKNFIKKRLDLCGCAR